jgi:REP element-mobilizing transposase RayT
MVATHVHLLIRIHPTTNLSRLLQRLKGGSAAMAGKEQRSIRGHTLRWAKGYSIHSISARVIGALRAYLRAQPTRHPNEAIPGWTGDNPEQDPSTHEEWISEQRTRGMRG